MSQMLKESYNKIEIPAELDNVILTSAAKGRRQQRRQEFIRNVLASAAAVIVLFSVSVNAMPNFGEAMEGIPGLGRVVSVLRLNKSGTGGVVSDGQEIGPITIANDTINIAFSSGGQPSSSAPWYKTSYHEFPYSLMVEVHGVRSLFAGGVMPDVRGSKYIKDIYRIVTLDDSAQRFVVTFTGPVDIELRELASPAGLEISLSPGQPTTMPHVYSVRTASHNFGELVGVMEEVLYEAIERQDNAVRILKDSEGKYLVEAGSFESEAEAQASIDRIMATGLIDFDLTIEKRGSLDAPKFTAP